MFEEIYPWKRPRARRFHDRWRIIAMLRERAKIYSPRPNEWEWCSTWEKVLADRERYVRTYVNARARCRSFWRGRKKNNFMTLQERKLLDSAEFQCRDEGVSLKHTRFKRNPW